eukprot:gene31820-38476_t
MAEMTKEILRKLCKENGLYTTPSINDKLYLHYKGFHVIQNLEAYTGLKALWLEGNGLGRISGLEHQTSLRTLYLHENLIEKIEGLDAQTDLDSLNISKNYIKTIENLGHMQKLTNLNVAHNRISTIDDVRHVLELPALQTLDLQHNKIDDPAIVDIVAQIPDLRVLYLMGNPVVKSIRNYRKTCIARCKMLKYLDDRPVFEDERRRVDAWAKVLENGGTQDEAQEAERQEILLIRKEKDEADERNFKAFEQLMREGQQIRKEREAARAAGLVEERVNPFTGETIVDVQESPELRELREKRWQALNAPSSVLPPPPPSISEEGANLLMPPPPPTPAELASAPAAVGSMRKMVIEEVNDEDEEDDQEEDGKGDEDEGEEGVQEEKQDEEGGLNQLESSSPSSASPTKEQPCHAEALLQAQEAMADCAYLELD